MMQRHLDELKKMKVLRLMRNVVEKRCRYISVGEECSKLCTGPAQGSLNSGATNPLKGKTPKDDMQKLREV